MNLGELQTALDRKTGLGFDSTAQISFINQALAAITAERPWTWLDATDSFNTVASTVAYTLPTDWIETRGMTIGATGRPMQPVSIRDGDVYNFLDPPMTDCYAIEGGNLRIYPTPSSVEAVVHRYVKREPTLTSASDTPILPTEFHPSIVAYAAKLEAERLGMEKQAAMWTREWDDWLVRMRGGNRRLQGPRRIRVRPGSGI